MESAKGRQLHAQAQDALEHQKNFELALRISDEALKAYDQDGDNTGASELLSSRSNIHEHMGNSNEAMADAKAAVERARASGTPEALTVPLFNLGKRQANRGNYQEASNNMDEALKLPLPERHNRASVKADIKAHLAYTNYMLGDKSAISMMDEAIGDLETADENRFEKDVWLSGAHMRAARMLRDDNPELAKSHIQKAIDIVEANPGLVIRKEQLAKLQEDLR